MPAEIIDGIQVAKSIRSAIRRQLKKRKLKPGLVIVQVGNDTASTIYIRNKQNDCKRIHFHSEVYRMPENSTQAEVINQVEQLNQREEIHGILVQMPVPAQIDEQAVIDAILPEKDADGLSPVNLGNLLANHEGVTACTPTGIIHLIESTGEAIEGKRAVCIGRSRLVGRPVGLMLLNRNATVTFCHTRTQDLAKEARGADILVVAAGQPGLINADMIKAGAIVIDVGITTTINNRLVGDVDFDGVKEVAGFITPVPGGVGPMTRAMLLQNTLKLAIAQADKMSE